MRIVSNVMQFSGPAVTVFAIVLIAIFGYTDKDFAMMCFASAAFGQTVMIIGSCISLRLKRPSSAQAMLRIIEDMERLADKHGELNWTGNVSRRSPFRGGCTSCEIGCHLPAHLRPPQHAFWPAYWTLLEKHGINIQVLKLSAKKKDGQSGKSYKPPDFLELIAEQLDSQTD